VKGGWGGASILPIKKNSKAQMILMKPASSGKDRLEDDGELVGTSVKTISETAVSSRSISTSETLGGEKDSQERVITGGESRREAPKDLSGRGGGDGKK